MKVRLYRQQWRHIYIRALEGKGFHVVTVNDCLAKRDADSMGGKIFNFLQMSVGYVLSSSTHADLARAYNCDVTYANNNELGFDLCT